MQTKHFIDDPTHLVNTALRSLTITNPSLAFDTENKIIYRRPEKDAKPKVSIITGGGSGHEPGFAGFVGKGLVTAGVAGTIFASPSAQQVRRAITTRVPHEQGVFVITMNYTGDVLNFGMAAEKAKAAGVATEFFAIGDDVGVGRSKGGKVGRRGIAGGILILKMCGALAELGGSLSEVYELAQLANKNLVSLGSSLEHVHVPGRAVSDEDKTTMSDEIEVGMGIHNEPGSHKIKASLPELIKIMLAYMLDAKDKDRYFTSFDFKKDQVVLFVNNLGGVSMLELAGITAEVSLQLDQDYGLKPVRVISGTFLTSLNGMGFSISILRLDDTKLGPGKSMLELLDLPAEAIGWAAPIQKSTWEATNDGTMSNTTTDTNMEKASNLTLDPSLAKSALKAGLSALISVEADVTRYDTIVGDGDCGVGLKRGAEAVLNLLDHSNIPSDAVSLVSRIAPVIEDTMDGTSGALYAIFINALAYSLRSVDSSSSFSSPTPITPTLWATALHNSLTDLAKYTPAQPGDRTLMDALVPFITTLQETGDVKKAGTAAMHGAEQTKHMQASLGRTVYIGGQEEFMGKIPDPGAYGLAVFLEGVVSAL